MSEIVFSAPQLVRARLNRELEKSPLQRLDKNNDGVISLSEQGILERPSQWQVLDERVIEAKPAVEVAEVKYLPEIRRVVPRPAVEYVEIPVPVEVEKIVPVETKIEVKDPKAADQIRLLKAQLARAYAGFEMHLRPLQVDLACGLDFWDFTWISAASTVHYGNPCSTCKCTCLPSCLRTCKQDRIRELEEQLENKPAPLETRRADSEEIRGLKEEIDMLRNRPTWTTVIPKVARPFQRRHEEPPPCTHTQSVHLHIYAGEATRGEDCVRGCTGRKNRGKDRTFCPFRVPPAPARARPLVTESGAVSLARFLQCDVRVQGGGASHPVRHAPGSTAQVEVPVYVEKEVIKEVEKPVFVDKVQVFPCCRLRTTH